MIIDSTYFEVGNFIPNLNEPDPNSKKSVDVDFYIRRAEEEVLSFAFGREMWEDFKTALNDPLNLSTEYTAILDGTMYTVEGEKCYWMGLKNDVTKESLLADYAYYIFHTSGITTSTEAGEIAMEDKVGKRTSMTRKLTKAYNSFVYRLHGGIRSGASGWTIEGDPYWLLGNKGVDYYGVYKRGGDVSLMQFLLDNKVDYPLLDLNVNRFGVTIKNEFGL